ncbi:phage tail assembly chaperone G [Virgibacillus sp. W0430]|uniref:phage tail assembly chaperone G n=1 Tax=Virgibacillus sp. W0430 TaxID=3391580 RepID=UPI003F48291B
MKLTLLIDGKKKIFTTSFVSARFYRKLLEYDQTIDYTDMNLDDYDEVVGFVCNVFDNQFTVDEFYDGIPSHELIQTLLDVFSYVRTGEVPKKEKGNEQGK